MERTDAIEKTGPKGNWLVVMGTYGRYIARTEMTKAEVSEAHAKGGVLRAEEAFELFSQLNVQTMQHPVTQEPVQQVGKMNLAVRIDASCFPLKINFSLYGTMVYWLEDLNQSDSIAYQDILRGAHDTADGWAKARAQNNSGLATASRMPANIPPPGKRA